MTKPFTLIALTGLAGSGKDTVADLLVVHCGFIKLAFADALRNEVADAFGIEPLYLTRRETKEHPMSALALNKCRATGFVDRVVASGLAGLDSLAAPRSPRQIMQWWGTDYRRRDNPDYWINQTRSRINYMLRDRLATRFVITDCRFPNEADMVRGDFGGQLWQITRPGIEPATSTAHASETDGSQFKPDATLSNNHDIRHLQQLVLGEFWAHDAGLESVKVEITA